MGPLGPAGAELAREELFAGRGQFHPFPVSLEQQHVVILFQLSDLFGNGWLGQG